MSNEQPDHISASFQRTPTDKGFLGNLTTNIKGPAVSVVLLGWLVAVVLVARSGTTAYPAYGLLSFFIAAYIGLLGRSP